MTRNVAPRAGAWIETNLTLGVTYQNRSHPARVRGLKHACYIEIKAGGKVAPRAGAWIETSWGQKASRRFRSHPARVRGLKLNGTCLGIIKVGRRTPRGCVD